MATTTDDTCPRLFDGDGVEEILVPIRAGAGSERGADLAGRYASMWHVPVRLLHVNATGADDHSIGVDTARLNLAFAHPDITVNGIELEADDVASGVAEVAGPRSLVFLASDRGSQWEEMGSIGEAVLQQSDHLVVLSGPRCVEPPVGTSIVVTLDGSTRAEAALAPALTMAQHQGRKLWVVTAVPPATVETVAALRARGQRVSESGYLRAVAGVLDEQGHDVGWEIVHDEDPVAGILSVVDMEDVSMIVAATHGDTGLAKRLFGSVCLGLVERSPVPVMVVRTDTRDALPLLATN